MNENELLVSYGSKSVIVAHSDIDSCEGCFFDSEKGCLLDAFESLGIDCVKGGSFREGIDEV